MTASRRAGRDAGPPAARPVPAPPRTAPVPVQPAAGKRADPQSEERTGDAGANSAKRGARRRPARRRRRGRVPDVAVVLVGPMAAGKTSLGRRLARELGVPFVDTDAVFVREHGAITEFFAAHGEPEFRRIEAEVIAEQLAEPGARIVALGGGAVLHPETRRRLAAHPVVLLMTTERAVLRTANLSRRPLLRDDPGAWGRILKERKPLYDEVADVTFRTDRATKEQLAVRAAEWVRAQGRRRAAEQARNRSRTEGETE